MPGQDYQGAERFLPASEADLGAVASAAGSCRGCDLFERATQTVFGSGPAPASMMLIGEQPGDAEDRQGKPFVGPAGRVLSQALADVGVPAEGTYITNAVKHFRWREDPRGGKRRIHERPSPWQVRACMPWLGAEIERVSPRLLVTLGATAGQALFGSSFRVGAQRGGRLTWRPPAETTASDLPSELVVVPTIHPSAVLRADDRDAVYAGLAADLRAAALVLGDTG
ncbi:MAG TPA: UdgX family uracil-DNA binding protein [Streptosporangiaceae bacterium]|nr:UdgX family uracil-DNA binding protein [Streptosporangiaceae bacterium]